MVRLSFWISKIKHKFWHFQIKQYILKIFIIAHKLAFLDILQKNGIFVY